MTFAEITTHLRDTSDRYGGLKDFLAAADRLDRALSEFFKEQTMESLVAVNGAVAAAMRCRSQTAVEFAGPVEA